MGFYKAGARDFWRRGAFASESDNAPLSDGVPSRILLLSLNSLETEKSEDAGSWSHFLPLIYLAAA